MKQFKNKKLFILFLLLLISIYIFFLRLVPLVHSYYKLKQTYAKKLNIENILKIRLANEERIKLKEFKTGKHRFSTYLLTILSYINYLRKNGYDIKIKINNKKELYKKSLPESKNIIIAINNISNIGIVFSLLKTFEAFPLEIKKISIKSGKNINAVINGKLIGFNKIG